MRVVIFITVTLLVWLQLPAAFGDFPPAWVRLGALVPALIACWLLSPSWRRSSYFRPIAVVLTAYITLVVIAILRDNHSLIAVYQAVGLLLVLFLAFLLFPPSLTRNDFERRARAVCLAPGVFAAANLTLLVLGLHPGTEGAGSTQVLGWLGISAERVQMPLADGVNNFGAIGAAGLVGSLIVAADAKSGQRSLPLFTAAASLCALLLSDSRAAIFFALAAALVVIFLVDRNRRRGGILLTICALVPLLILGFQGGGLPARTAAGLPTASTTTARSTIWDVSVEGLSHPSTEDLYGYGLFGQDRSGASIGYAYLFPYLEDPYRAPTHNLAFQTIFDTGYLGLAVLVLALILIGRALYAKQRISTAARGLFGMLVVLALVGVTESSPSIYYPGTLPLLILLGLASASRLTLPGSDDLDLAPLSAVEDQGHGGRVPDRPIPC